MKSNVYSLAEKWKHQHGVLKRLARCPQCGEDLAVNEGFFGLPSVIACHSADGESCPCCDGHGDVSCVSGCCEFTCQTCDGTGIKPLAHQNNPICLYEFAGHMSDAIDQLIPPEPWEAYVREAL